MEIMDIKPEQVEYVERTYDHLIKIPEELVNTLASDEHLEVELNRLFQHFISADEWIDLMTEHKRIVWNILSEPNEFTISRSSEKLRFDKIKFREYNDWGKAPD